MAAGAMAAIIAMLAAQQAVRLERERLERERQEEEKKENGVGDEDN